MHHFVEKSFLYDTSKLYNNLLKTEAVGLFFRSAWERGWYIIMHTWDVSEFCASFCCFHEICKGLGATCGTHTRKAIHYFMIMLVHNQAVSLGSVSIRILLYQPQAPRTKDEINVPIALSALRDKQAPKEPERGFIVCWQQQDRLPWKLQKHGHLIDRFTESMCPIGLWIEYCMIFACTCYCTDMWLRY